MIGLGTIVNTVAIIIGGLIGLISSRFFKKRYQETIIKAIGFAIIVMALGSIMSKMLVINISKVNNDLVTSLNTQGTIMMIICLALGALLGEVINIEHWFERFGSWLRDKSGNQEDKQFVDAFVLSSLTVCVGAMAIIGAIQDGISGDYNTLYAKALLDLIIIMIMTTTLGKRCIFASIPVVVFQGTITLLARVIAPIMNEIAISNLSLVGNVLIFCVGINLIWPKTIRVANVLPSIVIAVIFALI